METFINLNIGHLIISPSTMDQEKFRGYIPFIVNWIFSKKSISFYSISEEYGSNDHLHLDIIILSKSDINKNILNNKGNQKGLQGHLKEFMINNLPNTQFNRFYRYQNENTKNSKEYNIKFLIGYNFKETSNPKVKNNNTLGLSENEIQECIKFYQENETKIKNIIDKDVISLTPKNAMYEIKKFYSQKKNINYNSIISETVMKGYCWIGMSRAQTRKLVLQLKLIKEEAEKDEIIELDDDTFKKFDYDQEFENMKKIRHPLISRYDRLTHLYENNYLTKKEYDTLISPSQ